MAPPDRTGPLSQPGAPDAETAAPTPASPEAQPAAGRHDVAGTLGKGARDDLFEVFRQEKDGDPMRHAGNIVAPDIELAIHYAREMYGRRQESIRLWVVPRAQITDLSDPDLLQPPLDRSFKKPGGYVMRDKLEQARQRARAPTGEQ
jgi:ring-1,2-phenylacetyl-CoA epoxidase subunit PaaB